MNDVSKYDSGKDKASLVASYLFSLSLFSLAGSVVYCLSTLVKTMHFSARL